MVENSSEKLLIAATHAIRHVFFHNYPCNFSFYICLIASHLITCTHCISHAALCVKQIAWNSCLFLLFSIFTKIQFFVINICWFLYFFVTSRWLHLYCSLAFDQINTTCSCSTNVWWKWVFSRSHMNICRLCHTLQLYCMAML